MPKTLHGNSGSRVGRVAIGQRQAREIRRVCLPASRRFGGAAGRPCLVVLSGAAPANRTAAAQQAAALLGRSLQTFVRYIGETEKNVDRALRSAGRRSSVLLFDEVDALFGRPTVIKQSRDRYANSQTPHLLQRVASYAGFVILSTDLRTRINGAGGGGRSWLI